jgi:hypothetical protein
MRFPARARARRLVCGWWRRWAGKLRHGRAARGDGTETGAARPESSDARATDPEECERADPGSEAPAEDEQDHGDDEQGEDEQGQDEGDASDEVDSSDLAAAVRFLGL